MQGYPDDVTSKAAKERDETEKERIDRNLEELMAEMRVALPGVQVLFAFLLILPFNARFEMVTDFQRDVYLATILCTAISSLLLVCDFVFGATTAAVVAAGSALAFVTIWFLLPMSAARRSPRDR